MGMYNDLNLCNDSTEQPKAVVSTPKGQDDHPGHFHMGIPLVLLQNRDRIP